MIAVAYDVTSLAENRFGGISEVCRQTLVQASESGQVEPVALYRRGDPTNIDISNVEKKHISPLGGLVSRKFDIVHALGHRLPPTRGRKVVYTLHDAWSLYPNRYQGEEFQRKIGARITDELKRADAILAVSSATKEKLLELGLVEPSRCFVVPNGVAEPGLPAKEAENREIAALLEQDYVLFVGRLEVRKNVHHILEALLPARGLKLVIVGEKGYGGEQVEQELGRFPRERLHRFTGLSRPDLDLLYRHAFASLQPSWEEGFGLPILEAMIRGCPVITSNRSGAAEVAGEAAVLVDPDHSEQSTAALEEIQANPGHRESLVAAGKRRAAQFTWRSSFELTLSIYRRLLED